MSYSPASGDVIWQSDGPRPFRLCLTFEQVAEGLLRAQLEGQMLVAIDVAKIVRYGNALDVVSPKPAEGTQEVSTEKG